MMNNLAKLLLLSLPFCMNLSCGNVNKTRQNTAEVSHKDKIQMNKYNWIATECAPKEYPVRIFRGDLLYGEDGATSIPDGRTVNYGWGETGSIEVVGEDLKDAPHTLELTWISFTENKNYTGKFDLNVKLIDSLLNAGIPAENTPSGHDTYHYIKVGMAPGGVIVIWLGGAGKQVEVGRYQAKATDGVDWKVSLPNYEGTMKEYGKDILADLPEKVKHQIAENKIPYGAWDHWRRHFNWKPVFTGDAELSRLSLFMFNKESESLMGERLKNPQFAERAAVEKLSIFWKNSKGEEMRSQIDFDEQETDKIFTALKPDEQAELVLNVADNGGVVVKLKTKNTEIPFVKAKFNTYLR